MYVIISELYRLATRNDLSEMENQQVSRLIGGLRTTIQDKLSSQHVYTLNDAIQMATRIESQLERFGQRRRFTPSNQIQQALEERITGIEDLAITDPNFALAKPSGIR